MTDIINTEDLTSELLDSINNFNIQLTSSNQNILDIIREHGFLSSTLISTNEEIRDIDIIIKLYHGEKLDICFKKVLNITSLQVNIFILCFNESVLLPHTINHYRRNFPSSIITIYDNESTDNSVEIAKSLGCNVVSFSTNDGQNEFIQRDIKENCWKSIYKGWIIVIDMDEWLNITENDLYHEELKGTTLISIKGVNIIGESNSILLDDIDLNLMNKVVDDEKESKSLCFRVESIVFMNYNCGAHKCNPIGRISYSSKRYINKHMSYLGLPFILNKILLRYERTKKVLLDLTETLTYYTNDKERIEREYYDLLNNSYILEI